MMERDLSAKPKMDLRISALHSQLNWPVGLFEAQQVGGALPVVKSMYLPLGENAMSITLNETNASPLAFMFKLCICAEEPQRVPVSSARGDDLWLRGSV
jgi:hypothetical protein